MFTLHTEVQNTDYWPMLTSDIISNTLSRKDHNSDAKYTVLHELLQLELLLTKQ